ncbi:AAC(3) family N-acetyltransferase [Cohnella soli]|uniref:Aminoglycoside N(3)-acetyltransferase n=1 Tax=Cohnella soli TaxID=425005 RepID=A0ABW0I2J8_9BACL
MSKPVVTQEEMIRAFSQAGIVPSEIVLTHSSLKSLGDVQGGPLSVIDALKATVSNKGTVVFPSLVQRDFANAYRNWDREKSPSDVGLISETFRLLPDSLRSDQATHSVTAWGRQAEELTNSHSAYGPRMGVFGDYCFSYSSPWQKMYHENARILFIGVDLVYNTFKHFAEYVLVEYYCGLITDSRRKCVAMSKLATHDKPGVWPFHEGLKTQAMLEERGLVSHAACGNAALISVKAQDYVDLALEAFKADPAHWFDRPFLDWLERDVMSAI